MKLNHILLALTLALTTCTKDQDPASKSYLDGDGAFIINEGNYNAGNGSLSFYSYDSLLIYNDLFEDINGRPLGDVPNSVSIYGDRAYIIVNNSGKIEIVDLNTLESESSITGINSPRNIAFAGNGKGYITSMYSDSVSVLDISENKITGYINIRRSSESIQIIDGKAFVANWVGGDEIIVINTLTGKVSDSLKVGTEPESMVIDANKKLWVLCNGGWRRQYFAKLVSVNPADASVERVFIFPSILDSPSCLRISGDGKTLYYLDKGVRKMKIEASSLPAAPLIPEPVGTYFYSMGVNPSNGDIFVTDALDYQKNGYVSVYGNSGNLISKNEAGLIPGMICFKITSN